MSQPATTTGEKLMRGHAARLAFAARARGDDKIVVAGADRLDQRRNCGRIVGAVAVHEHDDVGAIGRLRTGKARKSVAAADADHVRARRAGALLGAVGAAAIGDDHPVDHLARQFGDDGGDRFRFVECRNDDGHLFPPRLWGRVGRGVVRFVCAA